MRPDVQTFVGLDACSRDGERIGQVRDVVRASDSDAVESLVIRYGTFRDLVVPVEAVRRKGRYVTVPFTRSFLDAAPPGGAGAKR